MTRALRNTIAIFLCIIVATVVWVSLSLTVFSDIDYVIIKATSKKSRILKEPFFQYLKYTDRIYEPREYPITLLQFSLNGFNDENVENKQVLRIADMLLSRGINIDQRNRRGLTALHEQVILNEPDVISFLLDRGANAELEVDIGKESSLKKLTPLKLAVWLHENSKPGGDWYEVISLLENQSKNE